MDVRRVMMCERQSTLTLRKELLDNLSSLLVYLVNGTLDLAGYTLDLRSMLAGAGLEQSRVLLRDLLDHLHETSITPDGVPVQLAHVRAARKPS